MTNLLRSGPAAYLDQKFNCKKLCVFIFPGDKDERVHLLGWSDGGITALVMAAAHPEVVDRVVVWGSNSYISDTDMKLVSQVRDVSGWSERMRKPMEEIYGVDGFPK